jgi:hypothetical protein
MSDRYSSPLGSGDGGASRLATRREVAIGNTGEKVNVAPRDARVNARPEAR